MLLPCFSLVTDSINLSKSSSSRFLSLRAKAISIENVAKNSENFQTVPNFLLSNRTKELFAVAIIASAKEQVRKCQKLSGSSLQTRGYKDFSRPNFDYDLPMLRACHQIFEIDGNLRVLLMCNVILKQSYNFNFIL